MLHRYEESHAPDTSLNISELKICKTYGQWETLTKAVGGSKNAGESLVDDAWHGGEVVERKNTLTLNWSGEGGR